MKLISLFAGVGGFDLGFERAGMQCVLQVEIDKYARQVLTHHWPNVPKMEDVRDVKKENTPPADVISFGSPCQGFSIAGYRRGIRDNRSSLIGEAFRIIGERKPAFAVWENVPGALSANGGRDFANVLAAFRQCGARDIAWRTLDTRYFAIPQRRQRIFLVADFRGERAAQILFESEGLRRDFAPRPQAGEGSPAVCGTLAASGARTARPAGQANELDLLALDVRNLRSNGSVSGTLQAKKTGGYSLNYTNPIALSHRVRRLTPRECERLQGFPDDWTAMCSDSQRYRQMGNAVSVPVAEWIGRRLVAQFKGGT